MRLVDGPWRDDPASRLAGECNDAVEVVVVVHDFDAVALSGRGNEQVRELDGSMRSGGREDGFNLKGAGSDPVVRGQHFVREVAVVSDLFVLRRTLGAVTDLDLDRGAGSDETGFDQRSQDLKHRRLVQASEGTGINEIGSYRCHERARVSGSAKSAS